MTSDDIPFMPIFQRPRPRHLAKLTADLMLAGAGWALALSLDPSVGLSGVGKGLLWVLLAGVSNYVFLLARQQFRMVGFHDCIAIVRGGLLLLATSSWVLLLPAATHHHIGFWLCATVFTCTLWILERGLIRSYFELKGRQKGFLRKRTLIIGAGRAGSLVAQELERHPNLGFMVVGFVDDDRAKHGLLLNGIRILDDRKGLAHLIAKHRIDQAILAIPSASGDQIRSLTDAVRATGTPIKTVPGIFNLLGDQPWHPELRDVSIEDLLRRTAVRIDQAGLASVIQGKTVLITGGGGSIGSELARQLCAFRPAHLVLLGRGEHSLWTTFRELNQVYPDQPVELELCDVRSKIRMNQALAHWKPFVVFHAAAHKHVPILEQYPEEGIENNILGTKNVVEACLAHGVKHFVNISTDKAVNPTNILGATKRVAELIVAKAARQAPMDYRYNSVRFGNVLGSRGSVVPIFQEQIRKGGPVTITSPDMTRYFMTIPEASQLVLQAGLLGNSGRVYVLDMGEPVRIMDLATDLIRLSGLVPGKDVHIEYTGIRPGEKLHEELFYADQPTQSHVHHRVMEAPNEPWDGGDMDRCLEDLYAAIRVQDGGVRIDRIVHTLTHLVPSYQPNLGALGRHTHGGTNGTPVLKEPAAGTQRDDSQEFRLPESLLPAQATAPKARGLNGNGRMVDGLTSAG